MLLELLVENFAVVEQSRIRFAEGLNVLTGETGSGKSIVVDSLGLLFGARASAEMVRSGETKSRIAGVFSVPSVAGVKALLKDAGLDDADDDELIIEREVGANGKSRAFVANRPVTTAFLRQLAASLGDIHGQNDQQKLFNMQEQRNLLDEYARSQPLRVRVASLYAEWRSLGERLNELNRNEQEKLRLLDLWLFQRNEIDGVQPQSGEDEKLAAERKILQNMTRLQDTAAATFDLLYESPQSANVQLRQAMKRADELARIDAGMEETAKALKQAVVLVEEVSFSMRDYLGRLEGDPARLEEVETRLAALERLKRKYGQTVEEILTFREDVARRIDEVENAGEHRAALERERAELAASYASASAELTQARMRAADRLSKKVENELDGLAMTGTRFQVVVAPSEWSATGADTVSFLVSPNRGEEPKPLEKIASGGELSRIALALKTALGDTARDEGIPTLVFDEVDAGVGGAAAAAIGRRLKALSRHNQVICVTHLAQIAGFADRHFAVAKRERKGRVTASVEELDRNERALEIGRMLSGEEITQDALRQAEQLIQAGAKS
jgi:DNA repair protein RecN (Recombination protein N)